MKIWSEDAKFRDANFLAHRHVANALRQQARGVLQMPNRAADDANPIDIHVGRRVRVRRKSLRMSQTQLADAIGITFQQVQKYERGTNRISASKLFETAQALNVEVGTFFEGLEREIVEESPTMGPSEFFEMDGAYALAEAYAALTPSMRLRLRKLAEAMSPVRSEDL